MIYVMSDIHGCYDKYMAMLEKIGFKDDDMLYILGDVLDRGPKGMKVLLDIANRKNVILLRGNHDQEAVFLLSNLYLMSQDETADRFAPLFQTWLSDGGNATMNEFLTLTDEEQERALSVVKKSLVSKELVVGEQRYLLSHTVPEIDKLEDYKNWTIDDFIMGEPDYEQVYFEDMIIISGHTPTGFIDSAFKGKIWKRNNHIAIDCGAVFGNSLGCLCLNTMAEFYV